MSSEPDAGDAALDRTLAAVADAHPERVDGWLRNEPGHWGFFAGQAVLAVRQLIRPPPGRLIRNAATSGMPPGSAAASMWLVLQQRRGGVIRDLEG